MEQRCGTRRPVKVDVYVHTRDAVCLLGQLCEISASGAFIRTPLAAKPSSYVAVQLLAAEPLPREILFVEGQIVHRTQDGIGIEWSHYGPGLVRYLTERVVRPSPVARCEP